MALYFYSIEILLRRDNLSSYIMFAAVLFQQPIAIFGVYNKVSFEHFNEVPRLVIYILKKKITQQTASDGSLFYRRFLKLQQ